MKFNSSDKDRQETKPLISILYFTLKGCVDEEICQGMLRGKIPHFRLTCVAQKRCCLSSLLPKPARQAQKGDEEN